MNMTFFKPLFFRWRETMTLTLDKKEVELVKQLIFLYITNPDLELDPVLEDVMLRLLYKLDLEWGD